MFFCGGGGKRGKLISVCMKIPVVIVCINIFVALEVPLPLREHGNNGLGIIKEVQNYLSFEV